MKIYGVALLAFCYLVGKYLGLTLGKLIGIDGDVGGVGFAMVLLIALSLGLKKKNWFEDESEKGILFWSSMYIPVVVAMASILNVKAAISGGWVALIVGVVVTISSFLLVPMISKIGQNERAK
ncbi:MAG: malonate transporter subunit MadL [Cytophagales bacterium]|nr:malonate transporter subunit MadL [Cytophagales bacterium]